MEFAWNTQKNQMGDVKGKEMEQERKGAISNEEIDLDKTHLNYDLVQDDRNLYQRVKDRVEEVRDVSRIQKNSVVDYSNIITVPKEQFEEWGLEKSKEYIKEVYNYFCNEFGKENVVSAKVHLDETTPHMHLHFVPVNKENGKLQARVVMNKARINKIHNEAPEYLRGKGFDVVRGQGKTEKSLDIHKYKAEKLKEKINELEQQYSKVKKINSCIADIEQISTKKSIAGNKVTLSSNEYEELVELAKQGIINKNKIEELERKLENANVLLSVNDRRGRQLLDEIMELKDENKQLNKDKDTLEKKIRDVNSVLGDMPEEDRTAFLESYKSKGNAEVSKKEETKVKQNNTKSYEYEA
jgi:hypothetical protein|nr:MobV family relaxase [uncultured Clostridium sp.]